MGVCSAKICFAERFINCKLHTAHDIKIHPKLTNVKFENRQLGERVDVISPLGVNFILTHLLTYSMEQSPS